MHALALSSTVVRVIDRCWARRMWWDDYLATLLLVIDPLVIAIYSTVFAHGCKLFEPSLSLQHIVNVGK